MHIRVNPTITTTTITTTLGPFHLKVWGGGGTEANSKFGTTLPAMVQNWGGRGGKAIQNSHPPPPPSHKNPLFPPPPPPPPPPNTGSRSCVSVKKCCHGTSEPYRETAKIAQVIAKIPDSRNIQGLRVRFRPP